MLVSLKIKNLRLRCVIGLNDWEREKKQDVVLNVELKYEAGAALAGDVVEEAVDYKKVSKRIITAVEATSYRMLESLAAAVLELVMQEPRVTEATVEVDKPHSLRFADSVSASLSARRQP
ncbi:dihydroneopterin aldolase [bacterium]|nr:dihydroneopterin aldolase [bacterium]